VSNESKKNQVYLAMIPYQFGPEDNPRTGWTTVGAAFPTKDEKGMVLEIRPGVSVSGRIVIVPRTSASASEKTEAEPEEAAAKSGFRRFEYPLAGVGLEDLV
jgi:hypothetical protein